MLHLGRLIGLFITVLFPGFLMAAPTIVPTVQQIILSNEKPIVVDKSWAIIANISDNDALFNANYLRESLVKEFQLHIDIFDINSSRAGENKRFVIGRPAVNSFISSIAQTRGLSLDDVSNEEGYILNASTVQRAPDILIMANQSVGVFYGIQSLLKQPNGLFQALYVDNNKIKIEQFTIKDWPDKKIRGAFNVFSSDNAYMEAYEWIDHMARWKMNLLSFGQDTSELVELEQIYAYAKKRHIHPVPFLRGLQGGPFVDADPNIVEGMMVTGERFTFVDDNGVYVAKPEIPVDQTSLILNQGFENLVNQTSALWYFANPDHWVWDQSVSHSGLASVKMHIPEIPEPKSTSGRLYMKPEAYIPVEGGKTYTLSFWAKTNDIGGSRQPFVRAIELNSSYGVTEGTHQGTATIRLPMGSTDWKQYFQPINVSEKTHYLNISALVGAGGYGTVWLDDFELHRMNGALVNVLRTETTNIRVSSEDGLIIYKEGEDYRVLDGILEPRTLADGVIHRFSSENTPSRIELLPAGKIDSSSSVLIDYDFVVMPVTGRYLPFNYSVNDARTYDQQVFPYLKEMIEALDVDYVLYSGSSEVRGINRDSRNNGMENHELIAKDFNNVYSYIKEVRPELKVFVWDDMMNPWHNGGKQYYQSENGGGRVGATEPVDDSLPRITDLIPRQDVIQWAWWYSEDTNNRIVNTPDYLESKSFQWIASGEYKKSDLKEERESNIMAWVQTMQNRPSCLGMIEWANRHNFSDIELTADYSWNINNATR